MKAGKNSRKRTGVRALAICSAVVLALCGAGYSIVRAMIDETNSVHIKAAEIEDSTLIIGTHLIYLGSMTDSIYETAQKSAEQSGQYERYYKSELAAGTWFDITDASSLADITTGGVPVKEAVIEELNMTHHTKSDGITYDLVTGEDVCVYDISSPYELEGLEELNPIKLQYDNMSAAEEHSGTDNRNMQLIRDFYEKDRNTDATREFDSQVDALQRYYEVLVRDGEDSTRSGIVQKIMKKVDASRRVEVFALLQDEDLQELITTISRNKIYMTPEEEAAKKAAYEQALREWQQAKEENPDEAGEEPQPEDVKMEDFYVDNNLLTAVNEALANVQESYNSYISNVLEEGTTILSQAEYETVVKLIEYAKEDNYSNCDEQVTWLLYLDRINGSTVGDAEEELSYIEDTLLPKADRAYTVSLGAGAGEEYRALPSTAANATKTNALKKQKNDTEAIRTELQFILQAGFDRMSTEDAVSLVKKRLDESEGYRQKIKTDAYQEYANASLNSYIEWLTKKLAELQKALGGGDMDKLQQDKAELQEQQLEALDRNDLAGAKKLEAEIEVIDKSMEEKEKELNTILNSDTATPAEKAAAAAGLGSGTASAAVRDLCADALEAIRSGDLAGVEEMVSAIGEMAAVSPDSALGALQDIYKELSSQKVAGEAGAGGDGSGSGTGGDGTESGDGSGNGSGTGGDGTGTGDGSGTGGDGTGTGDGAGESSALDELLARVEDVTAEQINNFVKGLSDKDLEKLLAAFFGQDGDTGGRETSLAALLTGLSDADAGAALAGLGMYKEETGSGAAGKAVVSYSPVEYKSGNPYVYRKLDQEPGQEFAALDALARVTKYRYIFNDSQKKVVLQRGANYYSFTAFRTEVERPGGGQEEMAQAAGFLSTVYAEEEYCKTAFAFECYYLPDCDYAVLLDAAGMQKAMDLFNYLMEMGGES